MNVQRMYLRIVDEPRQNRQSIAVNIVVVFVPLQYYLQLQIHLEILNLCESFYFRERISNHYKWIEKFVQFRLQ